MHAHAHLLHGVPLWACCGQGHLCQSSTSAFALQTFAPQTRRHLKLSIRNHSQSKLSWLSLAPFLHSLSIASLKILADKLQLLQDCFLAVIFDQRKVAYSNEIMFSAVKTCGHSLKHPVFKPMPRLLQSYIRCQVNGLTGWSSDISDILHLQNHLSQKFTLKIMEGVLLLTKCLLSCAKLIETGSVSVFNLGEHSLHGKKLQLFTAL